MTDQSPQTPVVTQIDSKSSIFEKTDPDLRRRIDQALADRQPPTYKFLHTVHQFLKARKDDRLAEARATRDAIAALEAGAE